MNPDEEHTSTRCGHVTVGADAVADPLDALNIALSWLDSGWSAHGYGADIARFHIENARDALAARKRDEDEAQP